jgi:hypothetical protein
MFKHFIGEIYLLERPPADEAVQLSLKMPKELIDDGGTGELSPLHSDGLNFISSTSLLIVSQLFFSKNRSRFNLL